MKVSSNSGAPILCAGMMALILLAFQTPASAHPCQGSTDTHKHCKNGDGDGGGGGGPEGLFHADLIGTFDFVPGLEIDICEPTDPPPAAGELDDQVVGYGTMGVSDQNHNLVWANLQTTGNGPGGVNKVYLDSRRGCAFTEHVNVQLFIDRNNCQGAEICFTGYFILVDLSDNRVAALAEGEVVIDPPIPLSFQEPTTVQLGQRFTMERQGKSAILGTLSFGEIVFTPDEDN